MMSLEELRKANPSTERIATMFDGFLKPAGSNSMQPAAIRAKSQHISSIVDINKNETLFGKKPYGSKTGMAQMSAINSETLKTDNNQQKTGSLPVAKIGNLPTGNDIQVLKDDIGNNESATKKTKIMRQLTEFKPEALNNREPPDINTINLKSASEKVDDNGEQLEVIRLSPEVNVGQPLCDQQISKSAKELSKNDAQIVDDKSKLNSTIDTSANEESKGGDIKQTTIQKSVSKSSTTKESENSSDSNRLNNFIRFLVLNM